jgi:WD40 repeat protein
MKTVSAPAFEHMAGLSRPDENPGYFLKTAQGLYINDITSRVKPQLISHEDVACIAVSPDGNHLAMIYQNSSLSQWQLTAGLIDSPRLLDSLANLTPPFDGLTYGPDGAFLVVTATGSDGERGLWRLDLNASPRDPLLLLRGEVKLSGNPFSPHGEQLALTLREAKGKSQIGLVDTTGRGHFTTLGEGTQILWQIQGHALVAAADDRAGNTQLWALEGAPSYERRQLSYFDSGVSSDTILTCDVDHVYASLPDTPTLVITRVAN